MRHLKVLCLDVGFIEFRVFCGSVEHTRLHAHCRVRVCRIVVCLLVAPASSAAFP